MDNKVEATDFDMMVRYFHAMEERIKTLELQVAKLTGSTTQHGEQVAAIPRSSRQFSINSANPGILKLKEDSFEGLGQQGPVYAIEMLVDDDGAVTKIRIRSEQLLKLLQSVMGTDIIPDSSKSIVMAQPFKALVCFESQLREKRANLDQESEDQSFHDSYEYPKSTSELIRPNETTESDKIGMREYLDILLEALTSDLAEVRAAYSSMRARSKELVAFAHLWYLFQPGDTVIEGRGQSAQAYRVLSVHEKASRGSQDIAGALPDMTSMVSINCLYIGYNGKHFGPLTKAFTIRHFHGKRPITSLPILPIHYLKEDHIEELLIDRGSKFSSFSMPRHQYYSGITVDKELPTDLDGDVIVDIELYYRDHPDMAPSDFAVIETDEEASIVYEDSEVDTYLTERFLKKNEELLKAFSYHWGRDTRLGAGHVILMPNVVWAFYLRGRRWHELDINMMVDVTYPENAFDYLVLPASHKSILTSLVTTHISQNSMRSDHLDGDIVRGKGKGLIMLFHGPPGVGKTSTAECLAVHSRKPLLPITAADIGTNPHDVEVSLQTVFGLSQRWGCILLFDEADIILQARDRSDFGRNAIVSVFLRVLEYYSGILIMTTTRVGTLDEAFKSRIHITLHFRQLDRDMYFKIWEAALLRLRRDRQIHINMTRVMAFVERTWDQSKDYQMNGRDIQNAVQSAVALAKYDAKREGGEIFLAPEHIEQVLRISNDFNKYMIAVHGGSDSDQARLAGDRYDEADWDKSAYSSRSDSIPLYTTSRHMTALAKGLIRPDSGSRW